MKNIVTATLWTTAWVAACITACITTVACSNGDGDEAAPSDGRAQQPLQAPGATAVEELCRTLMQRQRTCSDSFIPALVAARVASDNPAGIAAQDHAIGRAALVKEAFGEWAIDSLEPAIDALCEQIGASISRSKETELLDSGNACLARPGCDAFVTCAVPLSLHRWKE
jgi:hypothetical protein